MSGPATLTPPAAAGTTTNKKAFRHIQQSDLVRGINDRIADPGSINQRGSSLCGPATFWYTVLKTKRDAYIKYVSTMYEKGEATVGKLKCRPSQACRDFRPAKNIAAVDWVALATLRDAKNLFLNYSRPSQEASGATYPKELQSWFTQLGYQRTVETTQLFGDIVKNESHLRKAIELHRQGYSICFLVDHSILTGTNWWSCWPTHWIGLNQVLTYSKKNLSLRVFTWGNDIHPVMHKTADFLRCYYGYVAVK